MRDDLVALSATHLVKEYAAGHSLMQRSASRTIRAVSDVSLDLRRGEVLGLVGESGCGKSTLGRLLLRLEEPTSGTVFLDGADLAAMSREELRRARRGMQIVFQDPYSSLNPRMRVDQLVSEAWDIHREIDPSEGRGRRLTELLEMVGLRVSDKTKYPHEFSGGQLQRIGIARALAAQPSVLVCDEPVSALDVSVQAQIVNLLRDIQSEMELSCLFISHDLGIVRHLADRVAVMYMGEIVELGSREEIFGQPKHPYTIALLAAAPVPDPVVERERRRARSSAAHAGEVATQPRMRA